MASKLQPRTATSMTRPPPLPAPYWLTDWLTDCSSFSSVIIIVIFMNGIALSLPLPLPLPYWHSHAHKPSLQGIFDVTVSTQKRMLSATHQRLLGKWNTLHDNTIQCATLNYTIRHITTVLTFLISLSLPLLSLSVFLFSLSLSSSSLSLSLLLLLLLLSLSISLSLSSSSSSSSLSLSPSFSLFPAFYKLTIPVLWGEGDLKWFLRCIVLYSYGSSKL